MVDKAIEQKLMFRIQELAFLICNVNDPSFHALACLGYLCKMNEGDLNEYA